MIVCSYLFSAGPLLVANCSQFGHQVKICLLMLMLLLLVSISFLLFF